MHVAGSTHPPVPTTNTNTPFPTALDRSVGMTRGPRTVSSNKCAGRLTGVEWRSRIVDVGLF